MLDALQQQARHLAATAYLVVIDREDFIILWLTNSDKRQLARFQQWYKRVALQRAGQNQAVNFPVAQQPLHRAGLVLVHKCQQDIIIVLTRHIVN